MEDTYQDGWLKPKDIKITANINGKKKIQWRQEVFKLDVNQEIAVCCI